MSSEGIFAGIFVPLGLLILVVIAIYWLRVRAHKNNVNAHTSNYTNHSNCTKIY